MRLQHGFSAGTLPFGVFNERRSFLLDLPGANLSQFQTDMFCYVLEDWCSKNCVGLWSVQKDDARIVVHMDTDRDQVLFKFSEEFDMMQRRVSI